MEHPLAGPASPPKASSLCQSESAACCPTLPPSQLWKGNVAREMCPSGMLACVQQQVTEKSSLQRLNRKNGCDSLHKKSETGSPRDALEPHLHHVVKKLGWLFPLCQPQGIRHVSLQGHGAALPFHPHRAASKQEDLFLPCMCLFLREVSFSQPPDFPLLLTWPTCPGLPGTFLVSTGPGNPLSPWQI